MLSRNMQTIINRRGQTATLTKYSYGTYDPETGSASRTPTDYEIKAYFGNYTLTELNNDQVSMGSRRVSIAARDTNDNLIPEPGAEDVISGVGDTVVIKGVSKIYNSSTLVCYLCRVEE